MPTGSTFVPILGDFEIDAGLLVAPFVLQSGDNTDVPRSALATRQGAWRPGRLKTVIQLICPDSTLNDDGSYNLIVPLPRNLVVSADDAATAQNSYWPIVTITPTSAAGANQALAGFTSALSDTDQTVTINLVVGAPVGGTSVNWFIAIDFSHTLVS